MNQLTHLEGIPTPTRLSTRSSIEIISLPRTRQCRIFYHLKGNFSHLEENSDYFENMLETYPVTTALKPAKEVKNLYATLWKKLQKGRI